MFSIKLFKMLVVNESWGEKYSERIVKLMVDFISKPITLSEGFVFKTL